MTTMNNEDPADPSPHEPRELPEPVAWVHDVVAADNEPEQALSFAPDNFPLMGICGFRSVACRPLYTADQMREAIADELERQTKPPKWWTCPTHGDAKATAWGCPECVREMRDELAALRLLVRELRGRLERVKSEPQDTMSDSKAVSAMVRHAKLGLQAIERLDRAAEKEQPQ